MKLLITSVGRRVELVQAFRYGAEHIGIKLEIFGADITNTAPALCFCDKAVIVPKISDPDYIPFLKRFCAENEIDALLPMIDTDLILLSQNKNDFGKTRVIVSDEDKVALCRDKRLTAEYFHKVGLKRPVTVDDVRLYRSGWPAFIKPKDGSSSVSANTAHDRQELKAYAKQLPHGYIVQPYIKGDEYSVDILCDFDGNPIYITPRLRLAVRAGEILKGKIAQDEKIIEEVKTLIADYKPCGPITVQLIREHDTGDDYFIEINSRFGGGVPLSINAGADSAEMLLRLLNGENSGYIAGAAEDGVLFSRFEQTIMIK